MTAVKPKPGEMQTAAAKSGGEIGQAYRQAPRPPVAGLGLEHAGTGSAAGLAFALGVEVPRGHVIPVAPDKPGAAMMAISRIACFIVHVTGVGVAHAVFHCDLARLNERGR